MNAPIEKLFQCVFNKKTRKSVLKTYSFNFVEKPRMKILTTFAETLRMEFSVKALPLVAAKKTTVTKKKSITRKNHTIMRKMNWQKIRRKIDSQNRRILRRKHSMITYIKTNHSNISTDVE